MLGVLIAEGIVRTFANVSTVGQQLKDFDPLGTRYVPHGRFGYRQRPNTAYPFSNGTVAHSNSMGYRGPEVSRQKPPDTYRIVLLGESTTEGFGADDDETIDAHMRSMLSGRKAGTRFEVVNLGVGGYDAYQAYQRLLSDGLPLSPDLIILNTGINDVRNAPFADLEIPGPDPRTLIWESEMARLRAEEARGGPGPWTALKHYSYLARLPGFVRTRSSGAAAVERMDAAPPRLDAVKYFEYQVTQTIEAAMKIGAAVVLSNPPSALRFMDPKSMSYRGYWIIDAETTENYRQKLVESTKRLAAQFASQGHRVTYVSHDLPFDLFIDDCHLSGEGNRVVAADFVKAIAPFIDAAPSERSAQTAVSAPPESR